MVSRSNPQYFPQPQGLNLDQYNPETDYVIYSVSKAIFDGQVFDVHVDKNGQVIKVVQK